MKKIFYFVGLVFLLFMSGCGGSGSGSGTISLARDSVDLQVVDKFGNIDYDGTIFYNDAGVINEVDSEMGTHKINSEYLLDDDQVLSSKLSITDTSTDVTQEFDDYIQFSYDSLGNLLSLQAEDYLLRFTYNNDNLPIRLEREDEGVLDYIEYFTYDEEQKLILIEDDWDSDGEVDTNCTLIYDGNGYLVQVLESSSGYESSYILSYSEDGKLIKSEEDSDDDGEIDSTTTVTYERNKITITDEEDGNQIIFSYSDTEGEILSNNFVQILASDFDYIYPAYTEEFYKFIVGLDD